jgi:chromatin remodeling complex protein RSC6
MADAQIEAILPQKRGRKKKDLKENEPKKPITKKKNITKDLALNKEEITTEETEQKKTTTKKKKSTKDSALNKIKIAKEESTTKKKLTKDLALNKEEKVEENTKTEKKLTKDLALNKEEKVEENTKTEKKNYVTEDNILTYHTKFNEKLEQINLRKSKLEDFTTNYEKLYKDIEHAIKISKEKEKKLILPPRFDKPTLLSQKLADFLNKPYGTELSRIDVTHQILEYIWKHNLLNNSENKEISCNDELCHLLNVDLELDIVTVFNLRRYIKHNYPDDYLK